MTTTTGASIGVSSCTLSCNRCWKSVEDNAYVTSCSHFFCHDCARKSFSVPPSSLACPTCDTNLSERANGFVREVGQKTTNKTIQLCGLTPEQMSSRAIDFYLYQVDLMREHDRTSGKSREHDLQQECDQHKERIVHYENDVNTLTHQVKRLQEANDKMRGELDESMQKYEEKARQKRKLYEMYTSLKQKAENQGLLFSPPASQAPAIRHHRHSSPPPPPPLSISPPGSPPQPPALTQAAPIAPTLPPPRYSSVGGGGGGGGGLTSSVDETGGHRRQFSIHSPSLRAAAAVATSFQQQRRVKSPRFSIDQESVHHVDKFSALRSDMAQRARSPSVLQGQVLSSIASLPQRRPVLANITNSFTAPTATAHNTSASSGASLGMAGGVLSSFANSTTTPMQSFASCLRRPETPSRVRRGFPPMNS